MEQNRGMPISEFYTGGSLGGGPRIMTQVAEGSHSKVIESR